MSIKVETNKNFFETLGRFDNITGVEVGVFSDGSTYSDSDINTAESAFIQEFGSSKHNMPSRPFISDEFFDKVDLIENEVINKLFVETPYDILDKINSSLSQDMKNRIDNSLSHYQENAEYTIKKKGFNHPLFETGKMQNDIDSKIIKG